VNTVQFYQWMSKPDPLITGDNFNQIVRGMTTSAGRLYTPSFNYFVSTISECFPCMLVFIKNKNLVPNTKIY